VLEVTTREGGALRAAPRVRGEDVAASQWDALYQRLTWYGAFIRGALVGVMALEYVHDSALLRYA
jgi:hypothetical protein